jgi:two-component system LytT family response regulator
MNATGSLAVMIADDEAPARRKLARFLGEHDDVEVVAEAANGLDALDLIAMTKPALLFLDINMPDLDGIGVAEALARAEAPPAIVFVTAFDQFAVKAFEVSALDYLLKPYDRERFELALARARRSLDARSLPPDLAGVLATLRKEDRYVRRLLIPNDGRSFFAAAAEIVRLEAEGNNVVVFLRDGSRHAMRATLESLEARLDPAQFARVHRSHVVNIDAIREIAPWFRGDYKLTLRDGTEIAWSRRYAAKRPDLLN